MITDSLLCDNRATVMGGGLYVARQASAVVHGGTVSGIGLASHALHSAYLGGGIAIDRGGSATLNATLVLDHLATYGGGLYAAGAASQLSLNDVAITNNTAARLGHQIMQASGARIQADVATKTRTAQADLYDVFGAIDCISSAAMNDTQEENLVANSTASDMAYADWETC